MKDSMKNRRFRFQFDSYVSNEIEPNESSDKTTTIRMNDISIHRPNDQQ